MDYTIEYFTTISYDSNIEKILLGTSAGNVYFYDINNGFDSSINVTSFPISDIKVSGSVRVAAEGFEGNIYPF